MQILKNQEFSSLIIIHKNTWNLTETAKNSIYYIKWTILVQNSMKKWLFEDFDFDFFPPNLTLCCRFYCFCLSVFWTYNSIRQFLCNFFSNNLPVAAIQCTTKKVDQIEFPRTEFPLYSQLLFLFSCQSFEEKSEHWIHNSISLQHKFLTLSEKPRIRRM